MILFLGYASIGNKLSDLAKTEDAKSRLRQFFAIMLQADKARLNSLLDKEKSQSQNSAA